MSSKKITRVEGDEPSSNRNSGGTFVASKESVAKAKQLRLFAALAWIVAMGLQAYAIFGVLLKPPVNMTILIILIVVNLILAIVGSTLWKKSNRLDPASEKETVKFFIQNQLGAIMGVLAFLPLVILIFMSKDLSGKEKGIAGSIAAIALLIAGISGVDFNPASIEQYTEQTREIEILNNGNNLVYWTKYGTRYHLYTECYHINKDATSEIIEGSVASARELKNITELCKTCRSKRMKEIDMTEDDFQSRVEDDASDIMEENLEEVIAE
jgi:hypothetical protein